MWFWSKKKEKPPEVRLPGRATVLTVGSSASKPKQHAVNMRLRLLVELDSGLRYEVTTAWQVEQGLVPKVQEGCSHKIDAIEGSLWMVHPRDARIHWDSIRTPDDPKLRMLDEGPSNE